MTHRPWNAEITIESELAFQLALAIEPELARASFAHVGSGWDVDVWRAGEIAFRFPRRALGAACVENEIAVLPLLDGVLPLAIPMPRTVGEASPQFPWRYFSYRFVAGCPLEGAGLSAAERAALAEPLAAMLRRLHALGPGSAAHAAAKPDGMRRDLGVVAERALSRLSFLERAPWSELLAEVQARLAAPPPSPEHADTLIHGDVYFRHLLVDETTRRLCALIDWGDVCRGDPAVDLAAAYVTLPPGAREPFFASYGGVDAATRARARFLAIARHGVHVLAHALDVGDATLEREAGRSLENALDGE